MEIFNGEIGRIIKIDSLYPKQKHVSQKRGNEELTNDSIQISDDAKNYSLVEKLKQHIRDLPEVRKEKVEDARNKLASGGLGVSAEELAEKIIDERLWVK